MSTSGRTGAELMLDAITLVRDAKERIDRALRLLEEGNEDSSLAPAQRELTADTRVHILTQTLQKASQNLGQVLGSGSRLSKPWQFFNSSPPAVEPTAPGHRAEIEEVQAEAEPRPDPGPVSEPEAATAPAAENTDPSQNTQSIGRRVLTRFLTPISRLRSAETDSGGPSIITAAVAPSNSAAESPDDCTICFEAITTLCILQPCYHSFDMDCLMPWLRSVYTESQDEATLKCPLCRQVIDTIRHSIIGDGTATMVIVGPHFRQQFRDHGPGRPWENLVRTSSHVPTYRPGNDLDGRFPGNGTVISYWPNGPFIDELRHRQRAELLLNSRRSGIHPPFVREDHIADEAFEGMSRQDILDMLDRRERLNASRASELEAMGEGVSIDLHTDRSRPASHERPRIESAATGSRVQPVESPSSTRMAVVPPRSLVSTPEREESRRVPPARRSSTGARTETTSQAFMRGIAYTAIEEEMLTTQDEHQRAYYDRMLRCLQQGRASLGNRPLDGGEGTDPPSER